MKRMLVPAACMLALAVMAALTGEWGEAVGGVLFAGLFALIAFGEG